MNSGDDRNSPFQSCEETAWLSALRDLRGAGFPGCSQPIAGDGKTLDDLLDRFTHATPVDRDLHLAAIATLFLPPTLIPRNSAT